MTDSVFTRKKVASLTLGERMRKVRTDARLTVLDVARGTRVQQRYLEYLEAGVYQKLPADVYVRGYLRSFAQYFGMDAEVLVRLYDRERKVVQKIHPGTSVEQGPREALDQQTFQVTPKMISWTVFGAFVVGVVVYASLQLKSFTTEPLLTLTSPATESVTDQNAVTVAGTTERGTQLTINDESVFVKTDGSFEEQVVLQAGLNTIIVKAVNRFDREKSETVQIESTYRDPNQKTSEELAFEQAQQEGKFRVELFVAERPVKVTVVVDGTTAFDESLEVGKTLDFEASEAVVVSAEQGSGVLVRTNPNEEPRTLGSDGSVRNIRFTKDQNPLVESEATLPVEEAPKTE